MVAAEPEFTLGIEEEYFLVDRATRDVAGDPPAALLAECEALLAGQVGPEFLRSQIEVATGVCANLAEARAELRHLRATVAAVAARHGMAPIAAATHPFARPDAQKTTERRRYADLLDDLQGVGRRLAICGLHVHVGIPDDELRIDLLNQASYFLPHLLALSTSSPFWQGEDTGLKSYRLAVFDELPRTGMPERFDSWGEYRRHVDMLTGAGLIEDATKLWWDMRPSERFPTLEMRIADCCTTHRGCAVDRRPVSLPVAHAVAAEAREPALADLCPHADRREPLAGAALRHRPGPRRFRPRRDRRPSDLLEEILTLIGEDARHFGCEDEVRHARRILARGTSAHRQLAIFDQALAAGATRAQALAAVVDWLIEETVRGV